MNPSIDIGIQFLIPLFVALPLAMSLLIQLLARGRPLLSGWLSNITLLALVVIPELRISDLGLVDVTKFERVDLVVDP